MLDRGAEVEIIDQGVQLGIGQAATPVRIGCECCFHQVGAERPTLVARRRRYDGGYTTLAQQLDGRQRGTDPGVVASRMSGTGAPFGVR